MENIVIENLRVFSPQDMEVEIVERKGIGHPDTLADGIAESVSRALCKEYLKRFGILMHHNTDQCEIIGGKVRVDWGGGEIINPIYIILSGRATHRVGSYTVPVHKIAIKAAKEYLKATLRNIDIERAFRIDSKIGEGSDDLVNIFKREKICLSNDTSFGVGFAPYTPLENLVFKTEKFLNSIKFKKKFPFVGEDIKVMGCRIKKEIKLTIASAIISKYFKNAREYLHAKREIKKEIEEFVKSVYESAINIYINATDNEKGKNIKDFYLTLTGTSAEMGDDGSVGRGNRASGLITPCRPNEHGSLFW